MADRPDEELATELRALAAWLDTPEPPDVRAAVRARLAARTQPGARSANLTRAQPGAPSGNPTRSRPGVRRWLAAAAAIAVAVTVAVLPQGRAAVARVVDEVLHFAGVQVRNSPGGLPSLPASPSPLPSLRSAALDEARRRARFPIGVPAQLGVPEQVLLADPGPDGAPRVVSLIYRGGAVRLDEFDGELDPTFEKSAVGNGSRWVTVNGHSGLWFPEPHALTYLDRQGIRHTETARLAAPTLIWRDGAVTYRLEGPTTLAEATAIAASVS